MNQGMPEACLAQHPRHIPTVWRLRIALTHSALPSQTAPLSAQLEYVPHKECHGWRLTMLVPASGLIGVMLHPGIEGWHGSNSDCHVILLLAHPNQMWMHGILTMHFQLNFRFS